MRVIRRREELALVSLRQQDVARHGHAIECRINAEHGFTGQPSPGRLTMWHAPGGLGIRVDSHMAPDADVPPHYDSLVAKIVTSGMDRAECIARMKSALAELRVEGIAVNTDLHRFILEDAAFETGGVTIHYLEDRLRRRAEAGPGVGT